MRRSLKGLVSVLALGIMLGAGSVVALSLQPSTLTTPSIPLPPPHAQLCKTA